jgi:hypothetical protein
MRKMLSLLACGALLFFGLASLSAPAEARRDGIRAGYSVVHAHAGRAFRGSLQRSHIANRHIGRMHRRHANRRGRIIWRTVAPAVAGAAFVASCSYEYGRWRATHNIYWRDRYYACAN